MSTSALLRRAIKAVSEAIVDTPGSAPELTESLLRLVDASVKHESNLTANSAEVMGQVNELVRQVKMLQERCNLLESVANVKRVG